MASDKWRWPQWRRQDHDRGRYAPDLWSVWLAAPIWVTVASVLAGGIYLGLLALAASRPGPNGGPVVIDPLDVIKTTITVAGFVGAVLVGVYGYRKQRLVEGDARRADAEQFAQRYTTATDQLGHEKPAVRLGGVYAMARLADDWDEQRQVCIDVLCAYLRMPYEPDPASEKHREGEREVRYTIIRLIRDHLREPSAPNTWCGRDLDFTNATFDGGDFRGAKFTGGEVSFFGAKFAAGLVSFVGAEVTGGRLSFLSAKFTGGEISFGGAKFAGGVVVFEGAEFSGSNVSFSRAKFIGKVVSFAGAKFGGEAISFFGAEFAGGETSFFGAEFAGGETSFNYSEFTGGGVIFVRTKFTDGKVFFDEAKFVGGEIFFDKAEFVGGEISFDNAEYASGKVSFDDAEFTDSHITWGTFKPPAAWTALQVREQRQDEPPL
jgi:hypothetical protein